MEAASSERGLALTEGFRFLHYSFLQGQRPCVLLLSWLGDPLVTGDLLRS